MLYVELVNVIKEVYEKISKIVSEITRCPTREVKKMIRLSVCVIMLEVKPFALLHFK